MKPEDIRFRVAGDPEILKALEAFQEAEAQKRAMPDPLRLFKVRWDENDQPIYTPSKAWLYDDVSGLVDRVRRDAATACRKLACEHCASDVPVEFGGLARGEFTGLEEWQHAVEVSVPPGLIDRLAARFGFARMEKRVTIAVPCSASRIIQSFRLVPLPSVPGVNLKAYPEAYPQPYES